MSVLGPNKWFDAGDQRFNPDNILIDSREANFIVIIDKQTARWCGTSVPTIRRKCAARACCRVRWTRSSASMMRI
jgi:hypothetical protein